MRLKSNQKEANEKHTLDHFRMTHEKALIEGALRKASGNAAFAAEILGTTPRILSYRIRQYRIDVTAFYIYEGKKKKVIRRKKKQHKSIERGEGVQNGYFKKN